MKIYNKIPWGLALGTLGITAAGSFYGTAQLGLASVIGGALAKEKKELKTELALKLK